MARAHRPGRARTPYLVDGRLRGQADGLHPPEIATRRRVAAGSLQSVLDDESVYWLAPGQRHTWRWGGSGPLGVALAVRGAFGLEAGDVRDALTGPVDGSRCRTCGSPAARRRSASRARTPARR